ncbi:hypothetical protein CVM52_24280 [Pseudooceanicola lipolyticus]|uniref:Nicotinate-nucleotide--dimethylbenzimidazole phosphoribosyltransferase n=1 Tax=Pseudooceanicola lipolyticus TaxID=2029104 RepID=A0A2M8IU55_9RHOB|nr:nicotinate-nucleotide--dimethylbenzimidazole phosphoribosyltransferase [Pseudooceanicola lipolyticus]PJE34047.1 hypothetical protein CVM52_24280 [Pseudooceanicola lipolyticus]
MRSDLTDLSHLRRLLAQAPGPDTAALEGATARNGQLTKPPGALGRLEELAIWYAGWRGDPRPRIAAPQVIVFAGNHGVAAQGVSAFPPEVTEQMVLNFRAGGAAINQLAEAAGAKMDVHALDLDQPTADFTQTPAMSEAACLAALRGLMADPARTGTYHFAGAPDVSWAGFARAIFEQAGVDCAVEDIPTEAYPTPAARPKNSRLDCRSFEAAFGLARPDWRAGLREILAELGEMR